MNARRLIDTNILVYAFTADGSKAVTAEQILIEGGIITVQVLNEFVNVSRRKLRLEWPKVARNVSIVRTLVGPVLPLTIETHDDARALAERYQIGIYDALLVTSALRAGCDRLLTEDLQHEMQIDGLTIVNPFV